MKLGFIGLGRMGKNMVLHLLEQNIDVVGYNRTVSVVDEFEKEITTGNFTPSKSIKEFVEQLESPKIILVMVKAGQPVDDVIQELLKNGLNDGDIIIDGGNSFYKDSVRRHELLVKENIAYIDCGTSGGLEGARHGACLMLGGTKETVEELTWLWDALGTWTYFGPTGAGHFVKMVHNGVEYGIDQAFGEGFHLLAEGPYKDLDLQAVADNWSKGSVVRGWLIELLARAFSKDPKLSQYSGIAGGGQTGEWTKATAEEFKIPQPILDSALQSRKGSQAKPTFATKVVSALRFEYGGHKEEHS
jgi:6-phosphogluconate dehydrogenase